MTEHISVLGGLLAVHVLALAAPGPNVLVVTQTAARSTRRTGLLVAIGLATASIVWSGAAVIGLEAALLGHRWIYTGISFIGSCYLCLIGLRMIRNASSDLGPSSAATPSSDLQAFWLGLLTSLSNPKAMLFFAGLFTALLPPTLPDWLRVVAIGIIFLDSLCWHAALALFFSNERTQHFYERFGSWLDRAAGCTLVLIGLWLAISTYRTTT